MDRKMYQPTEKQEAKWAKFGTPTMPTDAEFKAQFAKSHHGKVTGWGLAKRDWIVSAMTGSREYQMGLWQGRVDKAQGLDYSEERNENTYNLGYFRGYTEYSLTDGNGWDPEQMRTFRAQYQK
jgi:hypothetical protein